MNLGRQGWGYSLAWMRILEGFLRRGQFELSLEGEGEVYSMEAEEII